MRGLRLTWVALWAWTACGDADGTTSGSSPGTTELGESTTGVGESTAELPTTSGPHASSDSGLDGSTTFSTITTGESSGPGPVCGDGVVDPGEECDDGPANGEMSACKLDCTAAFCGDGLVGPREACDDGNQVDDDECTNGCNLPACGDGILQPPEECDLGMANDDTGECTLACLLPTCGDGFVQPGNLEQCDDGNLVDTDACVGPCVPAACGDGFLQQGVEQCDDGNDVNTDDCIATCESATCGDGFLQQGVEQCDDGNVVDGDGCPANCELFCHAIGYDACPSGATQFCINEPIVATNSDHAQAACETCYGMPCYLETADCAGPGWGPQPLGLYICEDAYFGFADGCSGGPGRVWAICASFTTYGMWADP